MCIVVLVFVLQSRSCMVLVSATIIMSYSAQPLALYEELHFYLSLYSFILFLSIEHYSHRLAAILKRYRLHTVSGHTAQLHFVHTASGHLVSKWVGSKQFS